MIGISEVKKKSAGKRRGPQPWPEEIRRRTPIQFLCTTEEAGDIRRAAEIQGTPISDFIRELVLPKARRIVRAAGD